MTNKENVVKKLIENRTPISLFEHEMGKLKVHVVKPNEVAVSAYYTDQRRFFPTIDENDIVVGGDFG